MNGKWLRSYRIKHFFFNQICRQLNCMRCSVKKIVINKKEDCDT